MAMIELTKRDIDVLRKAQRVHVAIDGAAGTARMVGIREYRYIKKADPFDAPEDTERRAEFNVNTYPDRRGGTASFLIYSNKGTLWLLATKVLRPGDAIVVRATENGNGYSRAAIVRPGDGNDLEPRYHPAEYRGLHVDELRADVYRKGKTIAADILLDYDVCVDNTARSIRGRSIGTEYSLA